MNKFGKIQRVTALALLCVAFVIVGPVTAFAQRGSSLPALTNFDVRLALSNTNAPAVTRLKSTVPNARVRFDGITGSPAWITSPTGFLTGPQDAGISTAALSRSSAAGSNFVVRAFLEDHSDLFGHGPEVLDNALVKRNYTNSRSHLQSTVWQQQLDGITIFDALLIAHVTARGELVSLSSHFVPSPASAADSGTPG